MHTIVNGNKSLDIALIYILKNSSNENQVF